MGLRSLPDTSVYLTRKGGSMDRIYLLRETGELDIAEFERQNRSLALHLFSGEPLTGLDREMLDVILLSGTYGTRAMRVRNRMRDGRRLSYLLTRAFPPMRKMKWDYPVLRRLPVLLPACWVARLCRFAARKPWVILTETREIFRR